MQLWSIGNSKLAKALYQDKLVKIMDGLISNIAILVLVFENFLGYIHES